MVVFDKNGLIVAVITALLTTTVLVANNNSQSSQPIAAGRIAVPVTTTPGSTGGKTIQIGQLPLATITPSPSPTSSTPRTTPTATASPSCNSFISSGTTPFGPSPIVTLASTSNTNTCGTDYSFAQGNSTVINNIKRNERYGAGNGTGVCALARCVENGPVITLDACCSGQARAIDEPHGLCYHGFLESVSSVVGGGGKIYLTPHFCGG